MDIQILRRETAADHEAVEGAVPLMHAGLTVGEYTNVLTRFYVVVSAWEALAERVAPEWLQPMLAARRRAPLLAEDLAHFAVALPVEEAPLPEIGDAPKLLGAMYVMEGSTLGGQFIARHVEETLHLTEGKGNAFFRGHGPRTGAMFREFCDILKTRIPDEQTTAVVLSAKAMFAAFGSAMHAQAMQQE